MCDFVSYFFSKVNNMEEVKPLQQVELRDIVGEKELEEIRKNLRDEVKKSLNSDLTSEQRECIDAVEHVLLAHIKRSRKLERENESVIVEIEKLERQHSQSQVDSEKKLNEMQQQMEKLQTYIKSIPKEAEEAKIARQKLASAMNEEKPLTLNHEYEFISFLDAMVERGELSPANADNLVKMYKSVEKRAERNYSRYQMENYRLGLLLADERKWKKVKMSCNVALSQKCKNLEEELVNYKKFGAMKEVNRLRKREAELTHQLQLLADKMDNVEISLRYTECERDELQKKVKSMEKSFKQKKSLDDEVLIDEITSDSISNVQYALHKDKNENFKTENTSTA